MMDKRTFLIIADEQWQDLYRRTDYVAVLMYS